MYKKSLTGSSMHDGEREGVEAKKEGYWASNGSTCALGLEVSEEFTHIHFSRIRKWRVLDTTIDCGSDPVDTPHGDSFLPRSSITSWKRVVAYSWCCAMCAMLVRFGGRSRSPSPSPSASPSAGTRKSAWILGPEVSALFLFFSTLNSEYLSVQ